MVTRAPVLDQYAPLSYKQALDDRNRGNLAPSWVPATERRRITAYIMLAAYRLNCGRSFLPGYIPAVDRDKRREYGDPDLIIDRIRAGVLGDEPEIVVDGADAELPDEPDLPPPPDDPPEGATDIERRIATVRRQRWEAEANSIVDEWERQWSELPGLQERQDWLRQWADDEQAWAKIHEGEGDAVGLGDAVYTLAWSEERQRPVLRVFDPGFYFPVLDERSADLDFPTKVHLAWEYQDPTTSDRFVRRQTWELVALPDGELRRYPWNVDEDGNTVDSPVTCVFTDATWSLDRVDVSRGIPDLSEDGAGFARTEDGQEARRLDLGIDFLPVIHLPNTPASREHYGASALLVIAQLLDDIAAVDTDVQAGSALAAGPMVALAGGDPTKQMHVRPGTIIGIAKEGRMDVLDLSAGLSELRATRDSLRDLLSVNGRVPAEVLGRVKASEVPSGVALALSFSPFTQLVGALRMVRKAKYGLLLKMVQRLAQGAGVLPAGRNPQAGIAFGSIVPSDRSGVITDVTAALAAGAISTQTAVQTLVDAGFSIEDARGEVQRIRYEHPAAARDLADATGSEEAAAEFLGIDLPEQPAADAPQIELPDQPADTAPAGDRP